MTSPRIFVGTLTSGESEFEECCKAITNQTGVHVTHHIIQNLPEFEAHNALWTAWNDNKPNYDLFVKIDADTVLNRNTALLEIFDLFKNEDLTGAQIPLHDYFTDAPINGLNCFSPRVEFRPSKRKLFADHADFGHIKVLKGDAVSHLSPIGWHGKNPSPTQSFHFGFHRALKGQKDVLKKLANVWERHKDSPREWALAGASCAKWWMMGRTDYQSKIFRKYFIKMQDDDTRLKAVHDYCMKDGGLK